MRCVSATAASFLAMGGGFCHKTAGFVATPPTINNSFVASRCKHVTGMTARPAQGSGAPSMTSEPSRPTTRGEAIAAAAAGFLASAAVSVSAAGAVVPEALPACPTEGNCVSSTSFKLMQQGRYMAPWYYENDSSDASAAFSKLVAAVESDPQLNLIEKDAEGLYVAALAKSAVPPDGFDKVEFLFKPSDGLVSFKSKSMKNVYAGLVIIGDGGSNRNRLEKLRKKLGWSERGIDDYIIDQGITSGTTRAKGVLSELGWRESTVQSYGEEDDF